MRKKSENKNGFTLAELLIVVAIIAVLIAIAIPVFSSSLEKSREAADLANIRAAYAEAVTTYLSNGQSGSASAEVRNIQQKQSGWQTQENGGDPKLYTRIDGNEEEVDLPEDISGASKVTVTIDSTGVEVTKTS